MLHARWRTLAIVPGHPGGTVMGLANQLAYVGGLHRGRAPRVLNAEGLGLEEIAEVAFSMKQETTSWSMPAMVSGKVDLGETHDRALIIVAVESVISNPLATAVALAADGVLLAIELGVTSFEDARRTMEQIGPDHFIGSVIIRPR